MMMAQMGSSFKKSIFEEHVQVGLVDWAQRVKDKKAAKTASDGSGSGMPQLSSHAGGSSSAMGGLQLGRLVNKPKADLEASN